MKPVSRPSLEPTKPVYLWVEKYIKKLIAEGTYSYGDKIPSERDFADQLGISRMTIRRAIDKLIKAGVLQRRSSSGTYVRKLPLIERPVGFQMPMGLSERLKPSGETPQSKLLHFVVEQAGGKVARKLDIDEQAHVVLIRRLRLFAGHPICIETIYIPEALVPGLSMERLCSGNASLYDILEERYRIFPSGINENIRISYATEVEANLLELTPMDPVLLLKCVTFDDSGKPFEYLVSVNHPDRVVFESQGKQEKNGKRES